MAAENPVLLVLGLLGLYILTFCASSTLAKLAVGPDNAHFDQNSAVLLTEVLKLCIALTSLVWSGDVGELALQTDKPSVLAVKTLNYAIPAVLYVLHNNLVYIALAVLPLPTYQLLNNLKIITTGVVYRGMLGRELNVTQWLSLVLLMVGMMCISLDNAQPIKSKPEDIATASSSLHGLFLMIIFALCSAGAGVYSELLIKTSGSPVQVNNFWLYLYGALTSSAVYFYQRKPGQALLDGYNGYVYASIFISAIMGVVISFIFKYGDNIIKLFGGSLGALLSICVSAYLFDFVPGPVFWCGYVVVTCALIFYYGTPEAMYMSDLNAVQALMHMMNMPRKGAVSETTALSETIPLVQAHAKEGSRV